MQPGSLIAHRPVKLGADEFGGRLFQHPRALRGEQAVRSGDQPIEGRLPPSRAAVK
jgi:hypothetical protein